MIDHVGPSKHLLGRGFDYTQDLADASLSYSISSMVMVAILTYSAINVAYSLWLKHAIIVDVLCMVLDFVLRVLRGGWAINVEPTPWILVTTFLLALFLALAKRHHEL
jgi:4-hydroxybenzoate polyprenyltransferase